MRKDVVKKLKCDRMGNYVEIYNNFTEYRKLLDLNTYWETGMEGEVNFKDIILKVVQDKEIVLKKKNGRAFTDNQINKIWDDCTKLDIDCTTALDDMVIIVTRTFINSEYKLNYVPTKPRIEEV